MKKQFISFIENNELLVPNKKTLLAVSGGVDSMVMLYLFKESGYDFAVAHCNFSLRGNDSDADEQLVMQTCLNYGIKFFSRRFDTSEHARENDVSIQVAARNLRYAWFNDLCVENEFQSVAVAHNRNDVAETMLINLCRGTGLKGLTGIKPKTNGIIRPLLFVTRKKIEVFAHKKQIVYRTDLSNLDKKYARNRIRHAIFPELEQINKGVVENIVNTSQFLAQAWVAIENMNKGFAPQSRKVLGNEIHYSIEKLKNYPFSQVFLVDELVAFGFPASIVLDIEKSLYTQSGKIFKSNNYVLVRDRDSLIVSPVTAENNTVVLIDENTTEINSPIRLLFKQQVVEPTLNTPRLSSTGVFDYGKLTFPLTLRRWKDGDWFIPLGMRGRKKVSDFLVDKKVPLHQKQNVYVLESNSEILWVVGYRIDNRFKVNPDTEKVLIVNPLS